MATVYRAYHPRTEFARYRRYRRYTLHITALLALVGIASHAWPALGPCDLHALSHLSPWHYTGQNYGLAMMFARRNGAGPTDRDRRSLYRAFVASSRDARAVAEREWPDALTPVRHGPAAALAAGRGLYKD